MAVIVKYVVERGGKEVMTFATKKEADAYDKELDIAEQLQEFLHGCEIEFDETELEELTLFMARHRDVAIQLLKGQSAKPAPAPRKPRGTASDAAPSEAQSQNADTASAPAETPDSEAAVGESAPRRGRPKRVRAN